MGAERKAGQRGLLVVISSPSGGGKTTVVKRILDSGDDRFVYSVSATTRPPRPGEKDGRDYFFLSDEEFRRRIQEGAFAEWAEVHGHLYGTLKDQIDRNLKAGKIILLDIDVKGGLSLKRAFPEDSLLIFLAPPSLEVLEKRLRQRGTDSEEEINRRLQRVKMELDAAKQYDTVIVNEDLDTTVREVLEAIERRLLERSTSG
ncbi:MAG: guanylate kinase [Calditrichaeota bacterium]|nr:guanylate kinase [Calditrichota bacterium]